MRSSRHIVETITTHADGARTVSTVCTGRSVVEVMVLYRALNETKAAMIVDGALDKIAHTNED